MVINLKTPCAQCGVPERVMKGRTDDGMPRFHDYDCAVLWYNEKDPSRVAYTKGKGDKRGDQA